MIIDNPIVFNVRIDRSHVREVTFDMYQELLNFGQMCVHDYPRIWIELSSDLEYLDSDPSLNDLIGRSRIDIEKSIRQEAFQFETYQPHNTQNRFPI